MHRLSCLLTGLVTSLVSICSAQNLTCNANSSPPIVRGEGTTERVGDIVLNCSGGAGGSTISGNLSIFLSVNITNRVSAGIVSGLQFTIDSGQGPKALTVPATPAGPNSLFYNGLSFALSPTGTAVLRIANLRAAANQLMLMPYSSIQAYLGFNGGSLVSFTNTQSTVATVARSLFGGSSTKLVCAPGGSPLPDSTSFAAFLRSGAIYASTRVTEGFGDAFASRSAPASLNADSGTRIAVNYSGFPAGARLFVPDVVAGSDALQPTGAGDFGVAPSGGQYAPGGSGSLLLARVRNNVPVYVPGPAGSGTVAFDNVGEVPLSNGVGQVIYEVVDAADSTIESAQFPTFLGLAPAAVNTPVVTATDITLAPTSGDPIPRFQALSAPNDCSIIGDCSAKYFPLLFVDSAPLLYTAQAGSAYQVAYARVLNQGGGVLSWSAIVNYQSGTGWLRVSPDSGTNNATIRLDAVPGNLSAVDYHATVLVDGGPVAGARSIPVTLTITPAPPPVVVLPSVSKVVNAASFADGPVTPGSLATIQGTKLAGKVVSVTFNGLPAQILYTSDTQINVVVPAGLGTSQSAQLVVTTDGVASSPVNVNLAIYAPAIFPAGVLNQDYSPNSAANPAHPGSVIQIFATGLSGPGSISAKLGDTEVAVPYYAGPAPGLFGVQQVDLLLPTDLAGTAVAVSVCGNLPFFSGPCSASVIVTIAP